MISTISFYRFYGLVILLVISCFLQYLNAGIYLPGVSPHTYQRNEQVLVISAIISLFIEFYLCLRNIRACYHFMMDHGPLSAL
jgi:hypothetical protein